MQIARVRLFSLFGAMLFLLNLLTSNVIYHNICILSTLILKNLMYLKSIDELPTPFPLSAFITFHRLSLPFIAFHCLLSPFIAFYRRPISLSAHSLLPRFVLTSPRFVLVSPRFVLPSPRFVLASPRFVLTSPRFVLASPNSLAMPPHSPASHLLPSCFITPLCFTHPSFTHHCLRPLFLLPLFYSLHCFTSFVLFLPPLLYSLPLFTPFALFTPIVLHPFFTPRQPPQTRPRHRKRQRFSHFSKKFCKKPLTKQKKVLY